MANGQTLLNTDYLSGEESIRNIWLRFNVVLSFTNIRLLTEVYESFFVKK